MYIYYGEAIHQRCRQVYIYAYTPKNAGWYIYTNLQLGEYIYTNLRLGKYVYTNLSIYTNM